jgi:hypothetical protein
LQRTGQLTLENDFLKKSWLMPLIERQRMVDEKEKWDFYLNRVWKY